MRNLKLRLDDLSVDSFSIGEGAGQSGTVKANSGPSEWAGSCDISCVNSCNITCYGQVTCKGYKTCVVTE